MPAAVEESTTSNNSTAPIKNDTNEGEAENEKPDPDQQMWNVLKAYIMRDRARKKQEREQEVEEERLRKEREARAQQDVMTLGETREQISQLEQKLQQFKEEKHQLFLQLKKVLNEDDNRRKQLQKESNEQQMVQLQSLQQGMVPHQPQTLYIQQPQNPGRIQTIGQQAPPSLPPAAYKTAVKRQRSPSPPIQVPVYHQGYQSYKPPSVPAGSYQGSPQKAPQYTNQPSAFYPVGPQEIPVYYPGLPRDPAGRPVYDQQRPQGFQIDHKIQAEHYSALRTAPSQHGHVIHPGPGLAINPGQAAQPKGGSITAGYPVRSQPQYQQAAPASMYTTQSRQLFQNYPQRE
ncbi:G protein pathway suppressor 2 isoform X2 [Anthonomus grandis grandis]|uniref:G protein pathway suppressor 2 isoform X2 n=1 Tax=Anthonomus grandis grandis TaxID=2921223 RepID=UPI0021664FF8|nr:G protein pathway suppressor 2 isoform X2 [Anthonomus grandis grandis]